MNALQTQSIETERAYQMHKYVYLHSAGRVMTSEAVQLVLARPCPSVHVCSRSPLQAQRALPHKVCECYYPPKWKHYSVEIVLK